MNFTFSKDDAIEYDIFEAIILGYIRQKSKRGLCYQDKLREDLCFMSDDLIDASLFHLFLEGVISSESGCLFTKGDK